MKYLALWLCLLPCSVQAKPDLQRTMGETLAERGSTYMRFEHFDLRSADGQPQYRIYLGIPKQTAPANGYPALYMLDGNAALAALKEEWLAALDEQPVLVMIGYAGQRLINAQARTLDYTPSPRTGQPFIDDSSQGRMAGGAAAFLELVQSKIKPLVESRYTIDKQRQSLWGHSYGGLFVLNTLFTSPQAFQRYIAVSPSLWWQSGLILEVEKQLPNNANAQLLILHGEAEGQATQGREMPKARAEAMRAVGANALPELVTKLAAKPGLHVNYQQLPGLGHGPMLPASIAPALSVATEQTSP